MRETRFFRQADLLVQVMPFVNAEACFALKGGKAAAQKARSDFVRGWS